jgi:hypothetical protein
MSLTKKITFSLFVSVSALMITDALYNYVSSSGAGAPAGRTGSPGDGGLTCYNGTCHNTGPAPTLQAGWISSNIPGTGYVPGNTYNIIATATRAGHTKFGFEISPQSPTGTYLGTMIDTSIQTQIVSTKYITHTSSGTTGTSGFHTWAFNWTAPSIGTGTVTFYGAFNITNAQSNSSGDTIYTSTLAVAECARPAQPSVITGNTVVCSGSSQTYSVTNDPSADGYTWTLPAGWSGTANTNSITVTVGTAGGTISVGAFNNSCGISTLRTQNISVNNIIILSVSNNVLCFGGNNGSATVTPSGGSSPYSYLWSNSSTTQTVSNLTAGTYTVTVTDNIGCTKTAMVTITEPPLLQGCSPSLVNMCSGTAVLLPCCAGSGGTPPYSYSWSPTVGLSSTTICNPLVTAINPITYTAVITDNNGCTVSSVVNISIYPLPQTPVITQSLDTLFANSSALTFSWYLNGNPFSSGPDPYIITNQSGNYTVVATSVDGCTATSSAYPYFFTGSISNNSSVEFLIQPNPASSIITLKVPVEMGNCYLLISDILGNVIQKNYLELSRNQIDISNLREGVYFASAEKNGRKIMVRFTVMR